MTGNRLWVKRGEDGCLEVTGRQVLALGGGGIRMIENPSVRFVEYEEPRNG